MVCYGDAVSVALRIPVRFGVRGLTQRCVGPVPVKVWARWRESPHNQCGSRASLDSQTSGATLRTRPGSNKWKVYFYRCSPKHVTIKIIDSER